MDLAIRVLRKIHRDPVLMTKYMGGNINLMKPESFFVSLAPHDGNFKDQRIDYF